jgi:glycosyltransferase involved in cell wall biosynthesis
LSDDPDERDALIGRGFARARQFTWQKTAERTAEVYSSLL